MLNFTENIQILGVEMLCFVIGTVFFVSRYPERKYPGVFDLFLPSHTIFHVMVVIGSVFHYLGMVQIYQSRSSLVCPIIE